MRLRFKIPGPCGICFPNSLGIFWQTGGCGRWWEASPQRPKIVGKFCRGRSQDFNSQKALLPTVLAETELACWSASQQASLGRLWSQLHLRGTYHHSLAPLLRGAENIVRPSPDLAERRCPCLGRSLQLADLRLSKQNLGV